MFLKNRENSNLHPLCKKGGDRAMINQNQLILLPFGKSRDTWGEDIILGNNTAESCFALKDLNSMNFFK